MGQRQQKSIPKPEIQLTYSSRTQNLFYVPSKFSELEDIAYNFYYSMVDTRHPYEYLNLTYSSRGFIKQTITIHDKRTYKSAIKIVTKGTLQIEILAKANERLFTFKLKKIDNTVIKNTALALKQDIEDNKEIFSEVFEAYSKMLKVSNRLSQFISAHNTSSSMFAIITLMLTDTSKSTLNEKFTIIDTWPYIVLNADYLSENSSNILRIWNDFIFYLYKAIQNTEKILLGFENIASMIKSLSDLEKGPNRYLSSYKKVLKFIDTFKILQRRIGSMHEQIQEFSQSLKKDQVLSQLNCISGIIQTCGAYGSENFMNLFGITPVRKFFLS